MREIKSDLQQERRKYVPASMKVIATSMRRSICDASGNKDLIENPLDENDFE